MAGLFILSLVACSFKDVFKASRLCQARRPSSCLQAACRLMGEMSR